jgi:hypothetical protein
MARTEQRFISRMYLRHINGLCSKNDIADVEQLPLGVIALPLFKQSNDCETSFRPLISLEPVHDPLPHSFEWLDLDASVDSRFRGNFGKKNYSPFRISSCVARFTALSAEEALVSRLLIL